jgi:hypothetical protein
MCPLGADFVKPKRHCVAVAICVWRPAWNVETITGRRHQYDYAQQCQQPFSHDVASYLQAVSIFAPFSDESCPNSNQFLSA